MRARHSRVKSLPASIFSVLASRFS
jgi:hypothetical protein